MRGLVEPSRAPLRIVLYAAEMVLASSRLSPPQTSMLITHLSTQTQYHKMLQLFALLRVMNVSITQAVNIDPLLCSSVRLYLNQIYCNISQHVQRSSLGVKVFQLRYYDQGTSQRLTRAPEHLYRLYVKRLQQCMYAT